MSRTSLLVGIMICLSGCSWMYGAETRTGESSSLVDYLYPNGEIPPAISDEVPYLQLPIRVGIAFVPGQKTTGGALSEATKMRLLDDVRGEFIDREYIGHIEVIPETYLRSSRGIAGMQQVARLYGVDVMALVSYDQVAVSEENPSSFLYWTIVGSYIVKGTSNEVQTFVDTAVFDVATAKLLFRAPGVDAMSDRSTLVGSTETVRKARDESFGRAIGHMSLALQVELDQFAERVRNQTAYAQVSWREGYSGGGGALNGWFLVVLICFVCAFLPRRRI